jgi:hypothetical protein
LNTVIAKTKMIVFLVLDMLKSLNTKKTFEDRRPQEIWSGKVKTPQYDLQKILRAFMPKNCIHSLISFNNFNTVNMSFLELQE